LKEGSVALDENCYENGSEYPLLAGLLSAKRKPGCNDGEEVRPIASVHESGERGCPEPSSCARNAEPQSLHETRPRDRRQIQRRSDERCQKHARKGQNEQEVEDAPPRRGVLPKPGTQLMNQERKK
jgi:hypothetical protein